MSREINGLIDSGASDTCIPEEVLSSLPLRKISEELVEGATTKQGQAVMVSKYVADLDLLGLRFSAFPVYALPKPYALIGRDILNQYITTLNGPGLQFTLNIP